VIPIRDGAGPLDGKTEFARSFPVPPIAVNAADVISVLALFAYVSSEASAELHDFAAALLESPSMSHGCYTPEDMFRVVDQLMGRVPESADVERPVGSYVAGCSEERLVSVLTEVVAGWMNDEFKGKYRTAIADVVRRMAADSVIAQSDKVELQALIGKLKSDVDRSDCVFSKDRLVLYIDQFEEILAGSKLK